MNRGMASMEMLWTWVKGSCAMCVSGKWVFNRKNTIPDAPIANATGTPITRKIRNTIKTYIILSFSLHFRNDGCI